MGGESGWQTDVMERGIDNIQETPEKAATCVRFPALQPRLLRHEQANWSCAKSSLDGSVASACRLYKTR